MESLLIFILDLFGTAVFAVTGAVKGVRHKLDIFGVTVLACCVGVGGGMVRDCIIGAAPVAALRNEQYILICIATGIAVFYTAKYWMRYRDIIQFGDAVGLGVFTALGAQKGFCLRTQFYRHRPVRRIYRNRRRHHPRRPCRHSSGSSEERLLRDRLPDRRHSVLPAPAAETAFLPDVPDHSRHRDGHPSAGDPFQNPAPGGGTRQTVNSLRLFQEKYGNIRIGDINFKIFTVIMQDFMRRQWNNFPDAVRNPDFPYAASE